MDCDGCPEIEQERLVPSRVETAALEADADITSKMQNECMHDATGQKRLEYQIDDCVSRRQEQCDEEGQRLRLGLPHVGVAHGRCPRHDDEAQVYPQPHQIDRRQGGKNV
jgi:hypothetical protein